MTDLLNETPEERDRRELAEERRFIAAFDSLARYGVSRGYIRKIEMRSCVGAVESHLVTVEYIVELPRKRKKARKAKK